MEVALGEALSGEETDGSSDDGAKARRAGGLYSIPRKGSEAMDPLMPGGDAQVTSITTALSAAAATPALSAATPGNSDDFPVHPPAEVLDALDRAARVLGDLDRKNVSITLDHDTGSQQVRVTLHEANGPTRVLSGTSLLNLLDGALSEIETSSVPDPRQPGPRQR
ncbi:MAG TPA: hypothetical protein VG265_10100 [Gaiellaceae bacterium]|nr:hypothetical protein [Gaiellaceae bacterium]